ncbi:excinuclease ABC subunit UvrB [Candidatus Gottesmanbacteria bacterium]|nr:excinuclease ABC subunit UvrB [Candidatus Gottesmanbacteria bacterium]
MKFKLQSSFNPTGDQPQAINLLTKGIKHKLKNQVLLGVTGSGKTFTLANVIEKVQKPTLVISHNKTLAAQLYQEFRDFFPQNAVSYFVSYYDYYQPEAYIPQSDTYIEKVTEINEELDKLRLAATTNLLTRKDTIIVASVSCIYNIGSPKEYGNFVLDLRKNLKISRDSIITRLVELQYTRNNFHFTRGTFRIRGDTIDIYPAYTDYALRVNLDGVKIVTIVNLDPINGNISEEIKGTVIYPAKHYMTNPKNYTEVFKHIHKDLGERIKFFKSEGKDLEAHRISQKVNYDLEMIQEIGYVNGIENYSRYFDGRNPGDPPFTLLDYFRDPYKDDWLLLIDESHMTVPQIRGMYNGDKSRKQTLIDFGFRLPAALDNRPLTFTEFLSRTPQTIFVSATPDTWEISKTIEGVDKIKFSQSGIVEQLIRPTGIIDPKITIKPTTNQVLDLTHEILTRMLKKERVLVTTLTKKMAEELALYFNDKKYLAAAEFKNQNFSRLPIVHYLHSDIETLERSDILDDLRGGKYDAIIGINLLREGLDLPEVSLVAILDADKEGFLRSETSLIQTMGRAARHIHGEVIMYADQITKSMQRSIAEIDRRRLVQSDYNQKHGIIPQNIVKPIRSKLVQQQEEQETPSYSHLNEKKRVEYRNLLKIDENQLTPQDKRKLIKKLEVEMKFAAGELNFELAAELRDKIRLIAKS